jgi:hypothetical protein
MRGPKSEPIVLSLCSLTSPLLPQPPTPYIVSIVYDIAADLLNSLSPHVRFTPLDPPPAAECKPADQFIPGASTVNTTALYQSRREYNCVGR